jgi:Domain of unknown function (DUF4430)
MSARGALASLRALILAGGLAAGTLSGCGLGAGPAPGNVQLTVTSDFGAHLLHSWGSPQARGEETVMSLLVRNAHVATRYGGGFVESIDGDSGSQGAAGGVDWFYYVNGVLAPKGATGTVVHPGDRIWWDLHDWSQTDEIPAVVGSFPEPFTGGIEGKRLPVRIECVQLDSGPCRTVSRRLSALGVPAGLASVSAAGEEPDTLRVLVGPWATLRATAATHAIEQGPGVSGVYARLPAAGTQITVLDPEGRPARTLSAGAGLIAATRPAGEDPTWVVTGTSAAGVDRAARAFDAAALRDRFALALEPSGAALPVPFTGH